MSYDRLRDVAEKRITCRKRILGILSRYCPCTAYMAVFKACQDTRLTVAVSEARALVEEKSSENKKKRLRELSRKGPKKKKKKNKKTQSDMR